MKIVKLVLLGLMALFYVGSGVLHFTNSGVYLAIMPPYLPFHLELVYLSGIAEIALGVGVLIPATRVRAAWGLILLLIAVFPANVHMAMNVADFGGGWGPIIRLPFQVVFILWAWWYTRPERPAGEPNTV